MTNPTENNQCQIKHEDSSKKYFTIIPNCVYKLGLDPYEFRLYMQYCCAANEQTKLSWWSNKSLAKLCGMSERKLRECKSSLAKIRPELGNKPLIHIEHRKTEIGDWDTDIITVIDIWPENMKLILGGGGAQYAGGVRHDLPEGGARPAYKQEESNKTNMNNILPDLPKGSAGASKKDKKFTKEITDLCEDLLAEMRKIKPDYKFNKQQAYRWCEQFDYMIRLDKRDPATCVAVYKWALADTSFWCANLFKANPVKSLRTNFDQLEMKSRIPKIRPTQQQTQPIGETPQEAEWARINTKFFYDEKRISNGALDHCFIKNGYLNNSRNRTKDASIKVHPDLFAKLIEVVAGVEYCGV